MSRRAKNRCLAGIYRVVAAVHLSMTYNILSMTVSNQRTYIQQHINGLTITYPGRRRKNPL